MTDTVYNTGAAAEFLSERFRDKSPKYWRQRLINARRSDRPQTFPIRFFLVGKAAFYEQADLEQFVEAEKMKQLSGIKLTGRAAQAVRAFGIGEPGGSTFGRKLEHHANLHSDDNGNTFIQLIISNPLAVFRLEINEAEAFAKELGELVTSARKGK